MGIVDWLLKPSPVFEIALALKDPRKLAETLERSAKAARLTALYVADDALREGLEKGADMLDDMSSKIASGVALHHNYKAVAGIYTAWKEIDSNTIRRDPYRAARAFGRLFGHAGTIAEYLPPPLNVYAEFLAGFDNFFEDMLHKIDPASPKTPKGRAMRQALDEQL